MTCIKLMNCRLSQECVWFIRLDVYVGVDIAELIKVIESNGVSLRTGHGFLMLSTFLI